MIEQIKEVLQKCTIDGTTVKLPEGQLDRKLYQEVAKALELIGGKWKGGKVMGFQFQMDPTELLEEISTGVKRNLKKEFQFFGTPDALCDKIVKLAAITEADIVCEPSAGQGAFVKAINRLHPMKEVYCYEPMPTNKIFLDKILNVNWIGDDFLNPTTKFAELQFDKIVANPPFSKNQDIDHVKEMYRRLKPGGKLISITSNHWKQSSNKKETDFKTWLTEVGAKVGTIPAGTFKESGTNIETSVITITKAA